VRIEWNRETNQAVDCITHSRLLRLISDEATRKPWDAEEPSGEDSVVPVEFANNGSIRVDLEDCRRPFPPWRAQRQFDRGNPMKFRQVADDQTPKQPNVEKPSLDPQSGLLGVCQQVGYSWIVCLRIEALYEVAEVDVAVLHAAGRFELQISLEKQQPVERSAQHISPKVPSFSDPVKIDFKGIHRLQQFFAGVEAEDGEETVVHAHAADVQAVEQFRLTRNDRR
jgi:hypothetical protein